MKRSRSRRAVCSVREHVLSHAVFNSSSNAETVSFSSVVNDPSAWEEQFTKYVIPANLRKIRVHNCYWK